MTGKSADFGLYDQAFFGDLADQSYQAAKILLPRIYEMYPFESVVDFGCGSATWLRAAGETIRQDGQRLTGIDGEYARDIVRCDGATFIFQDLEQPIAVERHDLAISLEVAEHLTPQRAVSFVEDICNAADVVFFSAAVVGQGGTNHINEQPQSYWAEIFARFGYKPFIFHRKDYWHDPAFTVCSFYIASSFLYIKQGHPLFKQLSPLMAGDDDILDVVHPNLLSGRSDENYPFRLHVAQLVPSLRRALQRRRPGHRAP